MFRTPNLSSTARTALWFFAVHLIVVAALSGIEAFSSPYAGHTAAAAKRRVDFLVLPLVRWTAEETGPLLLRQSMIQNLGFEGAVFFSSTILYGGYGGALYGLLGLVVGGFVRRFKDERTGGGTVATSSAGWRDWRKNRP